MPKRIDYTLADEEVQHIVDAMNHDARPEVRQRATAVHLLHLGHGVPATAEMLAVSQATIYNWYHRWRADGLAGLANQPKAGRPRKATDEYVTLLEAVIEQDPSQFGYDFTLWTVDRLRAHLARHTGIELSATRFRALLKEQEYVYRRPKHDLHAQQDGAAYAAAEQTRERLKKKSCTTSPSSSSLWMRRP